MMKFLYLMGEEGFEPPTTRHLEIISIYYLPQPIRLGKYILTNVSYQARPPSHIKKECLNYIVDNKAFQLKFVFLKVRKTMIVLR